MRLSYWAILILLFFGIIYALGAFADIFTKEPDNATEKKIDSLGHFQLASTGLTYIALAIIIALLVKKTD